MRDLAQMLAHVHDAAMEVGEGRRRQRSAGEDDWNRRGRWREALKDGLGQRFDDLNHIRLPRRACMTKCG
jgi:hypothetical protein